MRIYPMITIHEFRLFNDVKVTYIKVPSKLLDSIRFCLSEPTLSTVENFQLSAYQSCLLHDHCSICSQFSLYLSINHSFLVTAQNLTHQMFPLQVI